MHQLFLISAAELLPVAVRIVVEETAKLYSRGYVFGPNVIGQVGLFDAARPHSVYEYAEAVVGFGRFISAFQFYVHIFPISKVSTFCRPYGSNILKRSNFPEYVSLG